MSKRVLNLFWGNFFQKKFYPSVPWRLESSKIFKKNQKKFKIPKMPEIVPKSIQTCFEHVLGQISRKLFDQCSMEARDFKFLKTVEKISKFQLCQKSLPKLSKCVLNMFWGIFFEKFLSPVLHGGSRLRKFSKKSKKFQNSKNAQNRSQKYSNVV